MFKTLSSTPTIYHDMLTCYSTSSLPYDHIIQGYILCTRICLLLLVISWFKIYKEKETTITARNEILLVCVTIFSLS